MWSQIRQGAGRVLVAAVIAFALVSQGLWHFATPAYAAEGVPGLTVGSEITLIVDDALANKFGQGSRAEKSFKQNMFNKPQNLRSIFDYKTLFSDRIASGHYGEDDGQFYSFSSGEVPKYQIQGARNFVGMPQEGESTLAIVNGIHQKFKAEGDYIGSAIAGSDVSVRKNQTWKTRLPSTFLTDEANATTESIAGRSEMYKEISGGKYVGTRFAAVMNRTPKLSPVGSPSSLVVPIDLNREITVEDLRNHLIPEEFRLTGEGPTTHRQWDAPTLAMLAYLIAQDNTSTPLDWQAQDLRRGYNFRIDYPYELRLIELKVPVTYEYVSQDAAIPLPTDIASLAPEKEQHEFKGSVRAQPVAQRTVTAQDGSEWEFVGWKKSNEGDTADTNLQAEKTFVANDYNDANNPLVNKFIGVWKRTKEAKKTAPLTYEYVDTEGNKVPDEINALKPADSNHEIGTEVQATSPTKDGAVTTQLDLDGFRWSFTGYKVNGTANDTIRIAEGENKFVGVWSKQKLYRVTYEFKGIDASSGTPQVVDAPDEAKGTNLPTDDTDYVLNQQVQAQDPQVKEIVAGDGHTWRFVGYKSAFDAEGTLADLTIADGENKFVGYWQKITTTVTYQFVVKGGGEVPSDIADLLPESSGGHKIGEDVNATEPAYDTVTIDDHVWRFNGYVVSADDSTPKPSLRTVEGENTFVGQWEKLYNVTYEFSSADPAVDLPAAIAGRLPERETSKLDKSVVTPASVADTTYVEDLGEGRSRVWSFDGWDEQSKTIDGADVKFVGTWSFKTRIPATPIEPVEPPDPTDPGKPVEPGKPTPPDPTDPGKPVEPGKPTPPDPTDPGKPVEPGKPTPPAEPTPSEPSTPRQPGERSDNPAVKTRTPLARTGSQPLGILASATLALLGGGMLLGWRRRASR